MKNKKLSWILASFCLSICIMLVKFIAYYFTNSNAILTDALESIVNVIASGFGIYSIYLASKPRDANHPYGHGKVEFFSEGVEGVLIILAALFVIYHNIVQFNNPIKLEKIDIGVVLIAIVSGINYFLGKKLILVGQQHESQTLKADGKHLIFDAQFGFVLITGLVLVLITGFQLIDTLISIGFSIYILISGISLVKSSVSALMDEVDDDLFDKVVEILKEKRSETWIDVHNLRLQKYGADLHIDCHLTLPRYLSLQESHEIVHDFEDSIRSKFVAEVEIFVHADPCLEQCCFHCGMTTCGIRKFAQTKSIEWNNTNLSVNQKHYLEIG